MTQTREELRAAIDTAVHQAAMHYEDAGTIGGQRAAVSDAVCTIMALIPEAPASTWIACSDAMPNEAMSVWVAYLYHDGTVQVAETEWADHCGLMDFWVPVPDRGGHYYPWPFRVTHWMPRTLPAPPAGEEE